MVFSPATRHAELLPSELTAMEGAQYHFRLSTEMGPDLHAFLLQSAKQDLGKSSAQEHPHAQLRNAVRQLFGRQGAQDAFSPACLSALAASDHQQTSSGVEHRRDTAL